MKSANSKEAPQKSRVSENVADIALNAAGILRDLVEDFRRSNRYFKYKLVVLASWLLLTTTTMFIACPPGTNNNAIGAYLAIAGSEQKPVYMVKNTGTADWEDVEIIVNQTYRTTAAKLPVNADITLSNKVLFDGDGLVAPDNLIIREITIYTTEAEDGVQLLRPPQ